MVQLEGLAQLKNPMTSGIEPATFQLVAQCLNQLCYRVRLLSMYNLIFENYNPIYNMISEQYNMVILMPWKNVPWMVRMMAFEVYLIL
jgi:hypothetical protein